MTFLFILRMRKNMKNIWDWYCNCSGSISCMQIWSSVTFTKIGFIIWVTLYFRWGYICRPWKDWSHYELDYSKKCDRWKIFYGAYVILSAIHWSILQGFTSSHFSYKEGNKVWMDIEVWRKLPAIEESSHKCTSFESCRTREILCGVYWCMWTRNWRSSYAR